MGLGRKVSVLAAVLVILSLARFRGSLLRRFLLCGAYVQVHGREAAIPDYSALKVWYKGQEVSDAAEMEFLLAAAEATASFKPKERCLQAWDWHEASSVRRWSRFSRRWQDSVLASLFAKANLGTTNRFYVEIGFDQEGYNPPDDGTGLRAFFHGPDTRMLHDDLGWEGLLIDDQFELLAANLHRERVTPQNVVSILRKYEAPTEPDYVSIDIESCDLWVFLSMTEHYRPRVVSIGYNPNYGLDQLKTVLCEAPDNGEPFAKRGDYIYGASLAALAKAARLRGYTIIAVVDVYDVFMVRADLVCGGSEVPLTTFANSTGFQWMLDHSAPVPPLREVMRWVTDF